MPVQDLDATTCSVCGSKRGAELIRLKDGAYRQCADCEIIFASPMPDDLEQINEEVFSDKLESYAAKIDTRLAYNRRKLRRLARYRKTGNWLEIGCNTGAALNVARALGWNAKGVELCLTAGSFARDRLGLDVFTGTVEAAAFPEGCFDVVFTDAVLEHLRDPLSTLRESCRILRPGGVFYADTVHWDSYTRRLLGAHWEYLQPKSHVHLYTLRNVALLCERAGLAPVRTWTTGVRVRPRSSANFESPWYLPVLKAPLKLLARWTHQGDHIEFLARKPQ